MTRKVKIILNPMADMGNAWTVANDLRPIIAEYGNADWSGTVYPTHATELAKQAGEQGYEMVIAMGGDGTVHEVVNGLMQATGGAEAGTLGILPLGTANDLADGLNLPGDLKSACQRLATASNSSSRRAFSGVTTVQRSLLAGIALVSPSSPGPRAPQTFAPRDLAFSIARL